MDGSKINRIRGMRGKAVAVMIAVCMAVMLPAAGCSKKAASSNGVKTVEKDYTKGQIMVIAATERNRYQNIYTSELWSVKADDSGVTFEDKLIDQIEQFLIELATTNMMADEQGVELTGQEKDSLKTLSKEYYRSLSDQDKDYIDVSESEIYDLYCEYYRADKLVGELTRNENLEVSDAEAKVIQVQQIELDTRERAEDILSQVRQENADFFSIATRSSKDAQILYTMEWNDHLDSRQEAAFALEQDEISGIVETSRGYEIIKCISTFNREETDRNKLKIVEKRKDEVFGQEYDSFVNSLAKNLNEPLWESVALIHDDQVTTSSFFDIYKEYFGQQ